MNVKVVTLIIHFVYRASPEYRISRKEKSPAVITVVVIVVHL